MKIIFNTFFQPIKIRQARSPETKTTWTTSTEMDLCWKRWPDRWLTYALTTQFFCHTTTAFLINDHWSGNPFPKGEQVYMVPINLKCFKSHNSAWRAPASQGENFSLFPKLIVLLPSKCWRPSDLKTQDRCLWISIYNVFVYILHLHCLTYKRHNQ